MRQSLPRCQQQCFGHSWRLELTLYTLLLQAEPLHFVLYEGAPSQLLMLDPLLRGTGGFVMMNVQPFIRSSILTRSSTLAGEPSLETGMPSSFHGGGRRWTTPVDYTYPR